MGDFIFTGDDLRDCFIGACITVMFILSMAWVLAYDSANLERRPIVKVYCGQGRVGHKALVDGIIEVRCAND